MPQKNKVAKKRLDKFYYLAKERGYRSRAAFKLLQLDQKYDFLAKSKGVLDLCAAPGSWMQVARQYMPKSSPCIGIDLAAIKPIPKCVALMEDITTQKCRAAIKREVGKDGVIDVVLHDGAPNVGTAWLQDAFGQNELTVHALKLATDVLEPGGTFVTKAFRSQDYNSLIYVFEQLFRRVEATKPQASRNESAEIFVVCQGFTNAKIDPRFLDPKYVFKELDADAGLTKQTNVLQQKKGTKARPEGYDTSSMILSRALPISSFVLGSAPVKALGEYNSFAWDGDKGGDGQAEQCAVWRGMKQTVPGIFEACRDLKMLGKKDFRMLLAWRLKAADAWKRHEKEHGAAAARAGGEGGSDDDDESEEEGEEAEEERAEEELTELERLAKQRAKSLKRKEADKRRKMKERLSLQMEHPGDRLDVSEDFELFSLKKIKTAAALSKVGTDASADVTLDEAEADGGFGGGGGAPGADSDDDDEGDYLDKLDRELNAMYADFQARSKRRAVAQLSLDNESGPKSKKKRRKEVNDAVERGEEESPDDIARREAARQLRGKLDDDDDDGGGGGEYEGGGRGGGGSDDESDDADVMGGGGYGRRNLDDDSDDDDDDDDGSDADADGGMVRTKARAKTKGGNPLLVDVATKPTRAERRSEASRAEANWFGQGLFAGVEDDDDEEDDEAAVAAMADAARARRQKGKGGGAAAAAEEEEEEAEEAAEKPPSRAASKKAAAASKGAAAAGGEQGSAAAAEAAGGGKPFIKSATFTGARAGYVFKRGAKGNGYYLDTAGGKAAGGKAAAAGKAGKAASGRAVDNRPVGMVGEAAAAATGRKRKASEAASSSSSSAAAASSKSQFAGRALQDVVPDDAKYVDAEGRGGRSVGSKREGKGEGGKAGGASGSQYVSDDDDDDDGDKLKLGGGGQKGVGTSAAESAQAAIERQAEAIVLGQMLLNPAKRRALEDASYNRHTRNDRGLPQWFLDDERKFAAPSGYGVELDAGMLDKARNSLKDISARTIGKVAEAKGRKQRRLQRAMTKLRKKANAVVAKDDLSEREKAREVEKIYKKKVDQKDRKRKQLVIGKRYEAGSAGKVGHGIKLVDKRLIADTRGEKRAAKRAKGKGPAKGRGNNLKGGGIGKGKEKRKGHHQHKAGNYKRR